MSSHPYFDTDGAIVALAHRGFSREGLENSMAAFQAAVDLGYRYVETDAHGTVDGVAVALHDASLDRTTDGAGKVSELPVKRVTAALIGGKEPVPTLEELLGTWPQLRVNIDVKAESGIVPIAEAIERTKSHDRVCLASFSTARRRATAARLSRPVATSAGTRETAAFALGSAARANVAGALRGVDALQVPVTAGPLRLVTAKSVRAAHGAGKHVHVWTINDPEQMNALVDLGVDGIVTDRADLLKEVLMARGRWE
ncbi:glycerophosphodiester phosphodiesterase [Demequina sp. TTPB684]|uniref:glycerophosphodiester phosphodiesterase n=1 Tax=unclassified Demequina TaxID=2620311 RepID=UPI001CF313A8|nr:MULTISPECIES: glycerophosphodiester phosphodiesterase [unclassified Demequina]MCB2413797.1 glycerophosphodiester phosphodiesterase [Demequina sp. TTPB684]UPU89295.1 glycerophosphodiester phosphodiesterase [Demequina sp. TMPB413]